MRTSQTWIEIDLGKIKDNYAEAKRLVGSGVTVTCVLKSNAYGHGAKRVAKALQAAGCQSFAVSCAREALMLRGCGIQGELIVMGATEKVFIEDLARKDITITLYDEDMDLSVPIKAQVKIDTGFHRLGFAADEAGVEAIVRLSQNKYIRLVGLYSHFSLVNADADAAQHEKLMWMRQMLQKRGVRIDDVHICDSIGMVRYPAYRHSRVRIGAFLYGVRPYGSEDMPFSCQETLRFMSTVTRVHKACKGDYVGYDDTAPLGRDTLIATVQVGYGDGYPRRLAKKASVMIRGQLAPVISLVCMDQIMADVTDIEGVKKGDEVTLLGGGISYQTYADWAGSNRNEMITVLTQRPQRVYIESGVIQDVEDLLI